MMHYQYDYAPHDGARLFFVLLLFAVLGAAVTAIVLAVRERQSRQAAAGTAPVGSTAAASDAMRILDERFARGEIDDEEYQRRRSVLRTT